MSAAQLKGDYKMKLAIVNQHSSTGGWRYVYFLIKHIKKLRPQWEITLFISNIDGVEEIEELKKEHIYIKKAQIRTKDFKTKQKFKNNFLNKLYNNIRKQLYLLKKRKKEKAVSAFNTFNDYDVVFYAWPYGIEAPETSSSVFFIPHDFIVSHGFGLDGCGFYPQTYWNDVYSQLKTFIDIKASPIVSSEYIRDEFNRIFPNAPKKPNIIYLSSFNEYKILSQDDIKKTLDKYGIKNKYILFANNFMPHNNLSQVLGAMYYVLQQYPYIKLIVSGYQNQEILGKINSPYYMDHTTDANNWDVKGLGLLPNDDFSAILQGAEIVINASLCEASAGSGLDAWSLGIPMVMSNIPAFKNQNNFLGVKAELFDPRNSTDIAHTILKILDNSDIAKENACISKEAMKKYSWDKVAEQYISIFEKGIK